MSDIKQFKLPDVGEGLTEAELVTWKVKVGDALEINDVIVEIETAKSLVELPSPYAGTVVELLAAEGDVVEVGAPIIRVETGEPDAASSEPTTGSGAVAEDLVPAPPAESAVEPGLIGGPAPGGRTSVLVGYGPRTTDAKRRPRKGATPTEASPAAAQVGVQHAFTPYATPAPDVDIAVAAPAAPSSLTAPTRAPMPVQPAPGTGRDVRVLAKPPVRKLARDLGVDLATVPASGPGGTITRADVERFVAGESDPVDTTEPLTGSVGGERRVPVKGVRKTMAQAMVSSAFSAPHVTEWVTLDATRTMKLVERLRASRDFRDVKVSPLLVVARAVCLAARRTPELNATWDEAAQEIVYKDYVNLGIAAATPRGLVVPNIKSAERMSARDLAQALHALVDVARAGRTAPADMSGGTFTITNVGVFGVDSGTPILNPPESGILAMGAIRRQPWVVAGKVKPRWVTTLALSFDHRVADGEQGSRFLADVASIVEDPGNSLLF
jgi:2-oxoisovalerate dehydrogenase E2 component (dihydrolipoyl transacylase)